MISTIVIFMLAMSVFSNTIASILAQNLNIIRVNRNSIEWLFTPNNSIANQLFKEVQLAIIPSRSTLLFNSIINLSEELAFEANISFHMIGRERIYCRMLSTASLVINNTIIRQSENIEGNMIIEKNSMVIQWHKYQISLSSSLLSSKKNVTTEIISKHLQSTVKSLNLSYVENLEGLLVVGYNQNHVLLEIIMYNIDINSTKYFYSVFQGNSISNELLDIPMRSDLDITLYQNKTSLGIRYSCTGMDTEDPIKTQLVYSIILPLIIDIQKIVDNIIITKVFGGSIINRVLTDLLPRINTLFIAPLMNTYSKISIGAINNNITDVKLIAIYKGVPSPIFYMALNSTNIYLVDESRTRSMVREFYNYISQSFNIFYENLEPWIENAFIERTVTTTLPQTQSMHLDDTALKLLAIVISIVFIQTFVIIYMIYRLYVYSKKSRG